MALNTSALQVGAVAIAADITRLTLHTADPGAAGTANTTTAGAQTVVCTAAAGVVTVPQTAFTGGAAGGPCTFAGLWNGATFRGSYALTGDSTFNSAGEYTLNASTLTGSST